MYQHQIIPFDKYEVHQFKNKATKNSFSLVPKHGACLLDVVIQNQPVLDGYQTPQELSVNRWAKNTVLFPFPNRMRNGQFSWEGKTYQFPINDHQTNTALHGFGMAQPMDVTSIGFTDEHATITCSYNYKGTLPYFPFPFNFHIRFTLSEPNRFDVEMSVQNTGASSMPIGLGWHPYFQLSEKVDELELQVPVSAMVGIDQYMIPTGKRYEYAEFEVAQRIGSTVLDNCFELPELAGKTKVHLKGPTGTLEYWQETGPQKFNYIQLFTPPYRSSLAIEPMTCNVDAFNNMEGLIHLEPDEKWSGQFGFSFSPLQ